ncbi:cytochrome B5-like [Macadamia integrifolia]|uniref:cytochrome B5-like n=1 Tax=Macadamia integrifolia TaxID=60698 RepID=UPI001C4E724C|nr:cytochrome B5-like [Macadamia integrifolia]
MAETKSFSLSEVSLHTSKKDCWIVVHGKVYDVTVFLEEHPGGEDPLLEAAAKGDATEDFEEVGHSSTATAMMSGYLIGVLKGASDSGDGAGSSKSVKEEKTERFVAAKATQEKQQSSSAFVNLIPLFIIVAAFAAWFYLNKVKI